MASVQYNSVGNLDGHQDPGGQFMYFTWAATHRHSAATSDPANHVWGNAYGVAWKRMHEVQLEYYAQE